MRFKLIYATAGGTTKRVTYIFEKVIRDNHHEVEAIDIGRSPYKENYKLVIEKMKDADLVGFGAPTYHMHLFEPLQRLFQTMSEECSSTKFSFRAFLYLTYGGITTGKVFLTSSRLLNLMGIGLVGALKITAPHFYKQLDEQPKFPDKETSQIIEEFFHRMQDKSYKPMEPSAMKRMFRPEKIRVTLIYPFTQFIGKKRSLRISIDNNRCVQCKRCVLECLVGAIESGKDVVINPSRCIHCYHCIVICKRNAVIADTEKLDKMITFNKRILGKEKNSNQIYI